MRSIFYSKYLKFCFAGLKNYTFLHNKKSGYIVENYYITTKYVL